MLSSPRDLALVRRRIPLLHNLDAHGRLSPYRRGDKSVPGPRFVMVRSRVGNTWTFRADLPRALTHALNTVCWAEPVRVDLTRPPSSATRVRIGLRIHAPIRHEWRGPACVLPPVAQPPRIAIRLQPTDTPVLHPDLAWVQTALPDIQPCFAIVETGRVVSACFSARIGRDAAEAGVETVAAYRGRGYASAATAAWAAAIQATGRAALYSTSWGNGASRAVARRLGARQYAEDWNIT